MNFKQMTETGWLAGQSGLTLLFRDSSVEVVWIDQSLLGPSVRMAESMPRNEQLAERLAEKIRADGKVPTRVLVCPPRALVMHRTLLYPASVQSDLESMLGFEVPRHVPLPESDRRTAYSSALLPGGKQLGVSLLAARASGLAALTAPLVAAGIPVDEVTPLSALLAPLFGQETVLCLITDAAQIELALYAGGVLQDSFLLSRRDAGSGGLSDAIRRMAAHRQPLLGSEGIGRIVLCGPVGLPPEEVQELEAAFGMHVHPLEIPAGLAQGAGAGVGAVSPDAVCAALADLPASLSLIERSGRKVRPGRRTLLTAGLCVLLVVELLAGWLVRTFAPEVSLRRTEARSAELRRTAGAVLALKDQNRSMRSELERLEELGRNRFGAMDVLNAVSGALPEDTYLTGMNYERGEQIRLRGRSKAPDKLPGIVQSLPFVAALEESDTGEKEGEYFGFTLSAALRRLVDE